MKNNIKPYHGHRARLREKFINNQLANYELLELLLSYAYARIDTKPKAKELLNHFGSLYNLFNSPLSKLESLGLSQLTCVLIKLVPQLNASMLKENLSMNNIFNSWQQIIDYCLINMGNLPYEQIRILYLNSKNHLIFDEIHQEGNMLETTFYINKIIKQALDSGSCKLILVHNHPSGDVKPSKADIESTGFLINSLKPLGISVLDHLIVGKNKYLSLKDAGYV